MIRPGREEDLETVLRQMQDEVCMPLWTPDHLRPYLTEKGRLLVDERDGRIAAFAVVEVLQIESEATAELEAILVAPEFRGQGVGRNLLAQLLKELSETAIDTIHLEVRASNQRAIRLYEDAGFCKDGTRRHYYRNPEEDAVLMSLHFPQEPVAALKSEC